MTDSAYWGLVSFYPCVRLRDKHRVLWIFCPTKNKSGLQKTLSDDMARNPMNENFEAPEWLVSASSWLWLCPGKMKGPFPSQTSKHSLLEKGLETPATGILESSCGLGLSLPIVSRHQGFLSLNSNRCHSYLPFLSSFSCHFKLSYFIDLCLVLACHPNLVWYIDTWTWVECT